MWSSVSQSQNGNVPYGSSNESQSMTSPQTGNYGSTGVNPLTPFQAVGMSPAFQQQLQQQQQQQQLQLQHHLTVSPSSTSSTTSAGSSSPPRQQQQQQPSSPPPTLLQLQQQQQHHLHQSSQNIDQINSNAAAIMQSHASMPPPPPNMVTNPLVIRKSYTLEPDYVGLQSQANPLINSSFTSAANQVSINSIYNPGTVNSGPLTKSYSYDSKNDVDQSSGGKIRRPKGTFTEASIKQDSGNNLKDSALNNRSFPYPSAAQLQQSRSSGSVDRLNRLNRTESNLSRVDSAISEEQDDTPHEGTYSWLENFKEKAITEEERQKAKPVFRACVNCKKAHLACDSGRPCKRCVHLGKASSCVDVEHKKRGRPKLPRTDDGTIVRPLKSEKSDGETDEDDEEAESPPKTKKESKKKEKKEKGSKSVPHQQVLQLSQPTAPNQQPNNHHHQQQPQQLQQQQQQQQHSPTNHQHILQQHQLQLAQPSLNQQPQPVINQLHQGKESFSINPQSTFGENDIEFLSIHTLEGYYSMASPECELLFGFTPQEYMYNSIYEFVHVDDLEHLSILHTKVLSNVNEVQKPIILRLKHKFGYYLRAELAMTAYKNPDTGKQHSIICSIRLLPASYESINPTFSNPAAYDLRQPYSAPPPPTHYMPSHPVHHPVLDMNPVHHIHPATYASSYYPQVIDPRSANLLKNDPEEPRQMLQHSLSFDTLSNTLGGLKLPVNPGQPSQIPPQMPISHHVMPPHHLQQPLPHQIPLQQQQSQQQSQSGVPPAAHLVPSLHPHLTQIHTISDPRVNGN